MKYSENRENESILSSRKRQTNLKNISDISAETQLSFPSPSGVREAVGRS